MATILKIFTPEQNYRLARDKVITDNVGLTNFNEGSNTRAILEATALTASTLGSDFQETTRQSIPLALFTGLGFTRKSASVSNGYFRFYRLPIFYMTYTGADTSALLTITSLFLTVTTSATPADDLNVDLGVFNTIDTLVAEINSKTNWTCVKIQNGSISDLYLYAAKEIVGVSNYRMLANSRDILPVSAPTVTLGTGIQTSVDDIIFQTSAASSIPAGDATSPVVAALSVQTGESANIDAEAIDTLSGKGLMVLPVTGVEHVINDSAFANGSTEETDDERALRFQTYIQGLHGGTVRGIESDILKIDGVKSVTLKERFPVVGYNTVIADDGTGNLSVALIDEIRKVLDGDPDDQVNYPGKGVAGIDYNIQPPIVVAINLTATIYRVGTISDSNEIRIAVQSVIERYSNTRRLGNDVVLAEIVALAKKAHPAVYDFVISVPSANVPIDLTEIPRTGSGTGGTVTLTVVTYPSLP